MRGEDQISPDQEIDFCTLGMFIIGKNTCFTASVMLLLLVYFSVEPGVDVT